MPKPLGAPERRVMGVLMEKVLATPAYYPMTPNALTAGCNQKNNRDPVVEMAEEEVLRTLASLQHDGLAVVIRMEGARVEKWKTTAREVYALATEKQMAVLAELLLRGPQSKAELRSRASRMRHEIEQGELDEIVDEFCARPEPLAQNLGRAPGGRADRYAHTLYLPEEMEALRTGAATAPAHAPSAERSPALAEKLDGALREIEALRDRVAALERTVAGLRGA